MLEDIPEWEKLVLECSDYLRIAKKDKNRGIDEHEIAMMGYGKKIVKEYLAWHLGTKDNNKVVEKFVIQMMEFILDKEGGLQRTPDLSILEIEEVLKLENEIQTYGDSITMKENEQRLQELRKKDELMCETLKEFLEAYREGALI